MYTVVHNLNLILVDAVCSLSTAKKKPFLEYLKHCMHSLPLVCPDIQYCKRNSKNKIDGGILALQRLSDTQCTSGKKAKDAVIKSLPEILKLLQ